ncbi:PREDICTED: 3 beta-hydroxysteroid dehydrogenase/Delta 5--_4-isomerase type 2-like [Priapulus caudatus]|uniref:3 beta-hydroxysteroid dehydrogenase/Delta 5-->4-isomerase type 2-like n=1 Tax=Priapulus caudatus TaxID=37621 RepID=A0ABM1EJM9_PRICU|nr:PREDICTED: 3 beta-hydroxysteroid dehydrogenase/Delta 5-->4-isomerase type 2-like [Priapulus caudatus]
MTSFRLYQGSIVTYAHKVCTLQVSSCITSTVHFSREVSRASLLLPAGETLHTLALRCNVMYGELDPYFVINALKAAKKYRGQLPQVGDGSALFQQAYVGNAAWAHVVAIDALRRRPLLGGGIYFIPDDTPLGSLYDFVRPFLESRGYGVSNYRLPFFLTYYALRAVELGCPRSGSSAPSGGWNSVAETHAVCSTRT